MKDSITGVLLHISAGAEVPGENFKVVIAELDVTHFVEVSREASELEQL